MSELVVSSKEQYLQLADGHSADILFDPFYKRWYFNLYLNGELLYAGVSLTPDTIGLLGIYGYSLGLVDKLSNNDAYEPYVELGVRLGLMEYQA